MGNQTLVVGATLREGICTMTDKPFRVVGGQAVAHPPEPDTRTQDEKLRAFFDDIFNLHPRSITVLLELSAPGGKGSLHEVRSFPPIDVAEIGSITLAYHAIKGYMTGVKASE